MCDMLQNNVNLLKIDLADNGLTDKDTVYLLDALKVVTVIFCGQFSPGVKYKVQRGLPSVKSPTRETRPDHNAENYVLSFSITECAG